jgi:hypothetical protein
MNEQSDDEDERVLQFLTVIAATSPNGIDEAYVRMYARDLKCSYDHLMRGSALFVQTGAVDIFCSCPEIQSSFSEDHPCLLNSDLAKHYHEQAKNAGGDVIKIIMNDINELRDNLLQD